LCITKKPPERFAVDDVPVVVNDNVNVVVDPGATLKTVPDCVAVLKLIAGPATLPWQP
jgi:hypothetical protein